MPIRETQPTLHKMHGERYIIPTETAHAIDQTHARGRKVVAVGTTTVRAVESWARGGRLEDISHLFITPGYKFQKVDGLLTNFHQPRTTLLLLVSALAGHQRIMAAYQEAIRKGYRLFSYGDAMLII